MNDEMLLARYVREKDQSAFAEIVRRRHAMVYGVALRKTSDPQLADDIAQSVFVILARKAAALGRGVIVSGWLFKAANLVACNASREEARRKHYEAKAFEASLIGEDSKAMDSFRMDSTLDDALMRLSDSERNAVLLRYMQELTVEEISEALGISPLAAQKRASRGIERLRKYFAKAGQALTLAALATLVTENLCEAAPPSVVDSAIYTASFTTVPNAHILTLCEGAIKQMVLVKMKIAACYVLGSAMMLSGTAYGVSRVQQAKASEAIVLASAANSDLMITESVEYDDSKSPKSSPIRKDTTTVYVSGNKMKVVLPNQIDLFDGDANTDTILQPQFKRASVIPIKAPSMLSSLFASIHPPKVTIKEMGAKSRFWGYQADLVKYTNESSQEKIDGYFWRCNDIKGAASLLRDEEYSKIYAIFGSRKDLGIVMKSSYNRFMPSNAEPEVWKTKVTFISNAPIPASTFEIPVGYKVTVLDH